MSDRAPCIKCGRSIDAYARICPYCNWSQDQPVPAVTPKDAAPVAEKPAYVPPPDKRWRKPVLGLAGGVVFLILAFVVGSLVVNEAPETEKPEQQTPVASGARGPQANVVLVPDSGPAPSFGDPITSAPTPTSTAPGGFDRTDATAVSSAEYAQIAQRAKAEKKTALVDPLTITGNAYGTPPRPRRPVLRERLSPEAAALPAGGMTSAAPNRTPPVPQYQPMPNIRVDRTTTARIIVTVAPDGRVSEVNVIEPIPGQTPRLIAAVQQWRFKPATLNGAPVTSTFSTAISFNGNE